MQITYSTPFTVGEILSQFQVNKELIEKSKPQPSVKNTPYTPARWLGRILKSDNALKPNPYLKNQNSLSPFILRTRGTSKEYLQPTSKVLQRIFNTQCSQ